MKQFEVPTRESVSEMNQAIFDDLKNKLGFVPNIYATYAYSDNALHRYLTFSSGRTSLSNKEKEAIFLVVSEVNGCVYCQAAHTALAKMNGFTDEEILAIRKGGASFDLRLDALVKLARSISLNRGRIAEHELHAFYNAGYDNENLVDTIVAVGEKSITNFLHKITNIPLDFPHVAPLQ